MRVSLLNKNNLLYLFVMLIFSVVFGCSNVFALDNLLIEDSTCEYSEAYIEWIELSEEERKSSIMPPICKNNSIASKQLKGNVRRQFSNLKAVSDPVWDIRNTKYKAAMKDQMSTGMCWAFSATTALEIFTMKSLNLDLLYSPTHIEYSTTKEFLDGDNEWGFGRTLNTGGNFLHSSAYLTGQVGPVLEEKMPFTNSLPKKNLESIDVEKAGIDVNSISISGGAQNTACSSASISEIKNAITRSGAVETTIYMVESTLYYRASTAAYYYNGTTSSNHAVTIVGWDDNYPISNFSNYTKPSRNGAWIVQNSYGEEFGDNGYFYVSYDDKKICNVYSTIEDIDASIEDNAYVHDKLGLNTFIGYQATDSDTYATYLLMNAYGMSVFTKEAKKEVLTEVMMGTRGPGKYKLYYKKGDASSTAIEDMQLIGEGRTSYEGYQTHKLNIPILLDESVTTFSIAVYMETDSLGHPLAVTDTESYEYTALPATPDKTYKSFYGYSTAYNPDIWEDLYGENLILSLRAFTNDYDYASAVVDYGVKKDQLNHTKFEITMNTNGLNKDKFSFNMINNKGASFTNYTLEHQVESGILKGVSFKLGSEIANGTYGANVYYDGKLIKTVYFNVYAGLASTVYSVNPLSKTIVITSPTEIDRFLENITGNQGKVKSKGLEVNSGNIGTGMTIDDYVIILKGDIDGNGKIEPMDYVKIKNHIMNNGLITEAAFITAADLDNNSLIEPMDYVKVKNYIMR